MRLIPWERFFSHGISVEFTQGFTGAWQPRQRMLSPRQHRKNETDHVSKAHAIRGAQRRLPSEFPAAIEKNKKTAAPAHGCFLYVL